MVTEPVISIRSAAPSDAPGIATVHLTTWQAQFTPLMPAWMIERKDLDPVSETARWQKRLTTEPNRITFVAVSDEQVVGFATGEAARGVTFGHEAELYQLYVLPAAQSKGIGQALVGHLALALSDAGFTSMLVWVVTVNPAVRFYRDVLGGTYLGERPIPEVDNLLQEAAYGWKDLKVLTERTHTR